MQPDDRLVPFDGSETDPVLDDLARELDEAGTFARDRQARTTDARPAFAADLRARLVTSYPVRPDVGVGVVAAGVPGPVTTQRIQPRVDSRRPAAFVPTPRWAVLAVAAVVLVAVVGLAPSRLFGGPAEMRVGDAVSATLTRAGTNTTLTPSASLEPGDTVSTGVGGFADLELGASLVRLDAGSAVRLVEATTTRIELDQTAGRAWHRVGGPGVTYLVHTGDVTWTADGTAFDLRFDGDPSGGARYVRGVGVEHEVAIDGPHLSATLDEGAVARIRLGDASGQVPEVALGPVEAGDLADPWLTMNAGRDARLGFDAGAFERRLADASPSPSEAAGSSIPAAASTPEAVESRGTGSPAPDGSSAPTPGATPIATPMPTAKPTPRPTPRPTATPKPTPTTLGLTATACDGGFTRLTWTTGPADGFDHYQTIRSTSSSIPAVDPPVAPGVAPAGLSTGERSVLSAIDAGLGAGSTVSYRTLSLTAGGSTTAASPVRTVTVRAVDALGPLTITPDGSAFTAGWAPYTGPEGCFGFYKLVVSTTDTTPSYLDGATAVWVGTAAVTSSAHTGALDPGTYHVRLQAFLESGSDKLLVAETDVADVMIP